MVSLDGFVDRPNGDRDWVLIDEEIHTFINNQQHEIDEFGLFVHPVVLGSGIPFFPVQDSSINLRLVEKRPFQSGVVYLRYQ